MSKILKKKHILYGEDAYRKLLMGISKTIRVITGSFGPIGSLVAIEKGKDRPPQLTNDGITIAKAIDLSCPFENLGCQVLKDVGDKVNEEVGDGTTSAMILSGEIFRNGMKGIVLVQMDRNSIIRGMNRAFDILLNSLDKYKRDVYFEDIERVAFMSSRNEEISFLIKKAYEKIGADGLITPGVSNGVENCLEIQDGAEYPIKTESLYLLDNIHETVMHNPYILVTNININSIRKLVPILTKIKDTGRRALIISAGCSPEVLRVLVLNKQQGGIRVATCKLNVAVPDKELGDIAVSTGSKFLDGVLNIDFRELELSDLGSAEQVIIKKDKLVIINGTYNKDSMTNKLEELNSLIENAPSSFDREKLNERLARLTGGIAVIRLGAYTESELKEKKMRLEDALNATSSALAGGIVKGGCGIYLDLLKDLIQHEHEFTGEEKVSFNIVVDSLENLYISLMNNSNLKGEVMLERAINIDNNMVYDILSKKFVNFEEGGIIESYLSIKTVLVRSRSIINTLLNVDVLIAEVHKRCKT